MGIVAAVSIAGTLDAVVGRIPVLASGTPKAVFPHRADLTHRCARFCNRTGRARYALFVMQHKIALARHTMV